jgi:outer membrane protein, heavy metal efflux system
VLAAAVVAGAAVGPAAPGPGAVGTNGLTLEAAIGLALERNPELRAADARVRAAAGRALQAGKWSNPELELSTEEWPVRGGRGWSDAKQTIGVAQTLPFPGKKSLDHEIGGAGVRLSAAECELRRIELVRDVKAAFFRVLASQQVVELGGEMVRVVASSAATAQKRVEAGATAYQEQLRAEIQLEQARTDQTGYARELAAARQVLAVLLGRPDPKEVSLVGALAEAPDPGLLAAPLEACWSGHPSAGAAQANLERARLEARRARLEPYPDVKVSLAGGRFGETDQSIIELRFSVPLPIIDRSKGRQQETRAQVLAAEAEWEAVQRQLQRAWADASQRYRTAVEQVANYRERILPKATAALRLVQTGFEEGKFNFIDLLDTQRTTAEARLAYQQKLLELNIAQGEMEALRPPSPGPSTPGK